ncbi:MAG: DUF4493 domain-containing protein [Rikenellaceae bacterium]
MKKFTILTTALSLLLFGSCGKDGIDYDNEDNNLSTEDSTSEVGYLALPEAIYVDYSSEDFVETKTSTSSEADDSYLVTITKNSDSSIAFDTTYGELKALDEIALSPAGYTIYVRSTDSIPLLGDEAHFSATKDFTIVSALTTTLDDLSCTMSNIKISVSFSADLLSLFKEDGGNADENLNVNVSIGESTASYGRDENGDIVFFQAVETSNTLELELSGMYNVAAENEDANYTMIEGWKQSITGVKAGQWRNISLNVEYSNAGSVDFTITITTWTYDEGIDVDVTSEIFQMSLAEPELDDPENYITDENAPSVTQGTDYASLDTVFYIDQNSFTLNTSLQPTCTNPLIINVEPAEGATLADMWIEFTSDNAALTSLMEAALGEKRREYILPTEDTSLYYTIDGNTFEATYDAMYQLYIYDGIHSATIMTKDSEGKASYNYLTIISSNEGIELPDTAPPTIEWRGGKDLDETYIVDPVEGLEVILDITSETGITGFTMTINSDVLTPDELEGISLAQTMDLITPGDCEAGLVFLGFPVGDDVKGQTEMVFDISDFMPQLLALGSGSSDFVLNVTDAGGTTTATLHIMIE